MKNIILKIAGVKDDKAFYKKFPTEEAFMAQHGDEFMLAQNGMSSIGSMKPTSGLKPIPKDQQLNSNYSELYTQGMKDLDFGYTPNNPNALSKIGNILQSQEIGQMFPKKMMQENVGANTYGDNRSMIAQDGFTSFNFGDSAIGNWGGAANTAGSLIQGFQDLKGEKNRRKQSEQMKQVSEVALQASRTRPEEYRRQYVRPEDIENTGEEFFPIYGVGTNPIAQNGMNMSNQYNQLIDYGLGEMYGENAGKSIGSTIGGVAGSFFGPAGSLVGKFAGGLIGGALDGNGRRIKKNTDATQRNVAAMAGMGVGSSVQQQYNNVVQDGGDLMGGDLQTHWGGEAELASYNPYLPQGGETVAFKGDMHNGNPTPGQSGIGISYGNSPVEVEGGEQATVLENENGEENLTVFGNLPIPKGILDDPNAKNKKFKNYIKDLSSKEDKANKLVSKNLIEIDSLDPITSFDKLKLSSLKANVMGNNMKLQDYAKKKEDAAALQKAINDTASEFGVVANDLARGRIKVDKGGFVPSNKTAKDGMDLPVYDEGGDVKDPKEETVVDTTKIKKVEIPAYLKAGYKPVPGTNLLKLVHPAPSATFSSSIKRNTSAKGNAPNRVGVNPKKGNGPTSSGSADFNKAFGEARKNNLKEFTFNGKKYTTEMSSGNKVDRPGEPSVNHLNPITVGDLRDNFSLGTNTNIMGTPTEDVVRYDEPGKPDEKTNWLGALNSVLPMWRPTDQSNFDNNQLLGEMYALSHNQVEPVHAQGYRPQLDVPYDISLQDQLNAITSQSRTAQRMSGYNPAAQAAIAAQAYDPSTRVLGEQFRLNQAKKDQVYSQNRNTMNDAQLKNLGIFADQAHKQSMARSNTKEATQLALNSISDKYAKHNLENRTLGIYENMYNYRYDNKGRARNYNPLAEFDYQYKGGGGNTGQGSIEDQIYANEEENKKLKEERKAAREAAGGTPGIRNQNGGNTKKVIKEIPLVRALKGY